jgi:hypothetical protein
LAKLAIAGQFGINEHSNRQGKSDAATSRLAAWQLLIFRFII